MTVEPVIDAEVVDLTTEEAGEVTSRIRLWVKGFPADDVKRAYFGRAWKALNYESWEEWCDKEFDGFMLPTPERRELVQGLSDAGMSNRSIGLLLGVSKDTVNRDRRGSNDPPKPVTGSDGKVYRPQHREPDGDAESHEDNDDDACEPDEDPNLVSLDSFANLLDSATLDADDITNLDGVDPEQAEDYLDRFGEYGEFGVRYRRICELLLKAANGT